MRKLILLCASLCSMAVLFAASPVRAQAVVFVSPSGSDTNNCTSVQPCLTFQGVLNKIGGLNNIQINCIGSGLYNFGGFTITQSITIDCGDGNVGDVVATSGAAITINTGGAAATVILRHLNLNNFGTTAGSAIDATAFSSGTLIIEDCMIHGFHNGNGLYFTPTGGRGLLQLSNSQFFDNVDGIAVAPASGQIASVTLNRVELVANSNYGLVLGGAGVIAGTMRDSVAGENAFAGVLANAGQVYFTVEESSIVDNLGYGIQTGSPSAFVKVGASTIGGNGTGINTNPGSIISFGNNQMSDNGADGNFTSTKPLK